MATTQRRIIYGRGGKTPMFGKGDRTKTATPESAGPQTAGMTSQKSKRNPRFNEGGATKFGPSKSVPAKAGRTGTTSVRAVGGEARRARPGECGT